MSEHEIDPSTGKPRAVWDNTPEIATKHADKHADRAGEVLTLYVINDGLTAWGRVLRPGEVVEVTIGSPEFWETCSPLDGASWLFLDGDSQLQRWRKVMFTHHPPPSREVAEAESDADPLVAARRRYEERMRARERGGIEAAWREQDEEAEQPLTIVNAERRIARGI